MAIPDPPKAGSPFCALWTGGWNPKTPKINNFFIPEITLRGGWPNPQTPNASGKCHLRSKATLRWVSFPRVVAMHGIACGGICPL